MKKEGKGRRKEEMSASERSFENRAALQLEEEKSRKESKNNNQHEREKE